MPRRRFQLPDPATENRSAKRSAEAVSVLGGDLLRRRAHGHPSELTGGLLYDPIFSAEDVKTLQQWCVPDPERPLAIEIGFQRARFAAQWCSANPTWRYLGFEVRKKFCEDADAWLVKHDVDNARLALVDARAMLLELVEPATVAAMFCFFPDPWWKKKHIKKRLLTRSFAELAALLLKPGGVLVVKTDVRGYADWAEEELRAIDLWTVNRLADATAGLPLTQRERRCHMRGLPTWAIEARKHSQTDAQE